ncbi:pollen-specific leucine-rich repeat extensin-like protein 1 isoform X1 [Ananas comosus]|uniref:Pollen-specific leucine-rich repeat extensin-like protein 1 isoform X1 n=1 Tax=Ananas comosus TaxID=4615 RepID=A0A6P5FUF1_ANACO|nr:pollen-specific leucine-rich repeat extensin-like protein 1 isoform X1 [Ananas comosus]
MEYDYRNRTGSNMYRPAPGGGAASGASAPPLYPRMGQGAAAVAPPPPQHSRGAPYHNPSPSSSSSAPPSSGLGIKVAIKPEYQITPPPQLAQPMPEVPRSTFKFDFEFEKRILAEAEKESQNWSRFAAENKSSKPAASTLPTPGGDPVVEKYVASGLGREAVSFAVLNYGDNPVKVREFVKGYNLLREMGFASKNVAEVLASYDNDTDKAIAHFLNSPN